MNSTEMMERFRRFASTDLFITTPNRMHQVSETLLKTNAVRIILTRDERRTESLDVEVEVSLPFLPETSDATSIQEYIDSAIATLEYLKRLTSIGFGLEVVQEEGILIASAALSVDTEDYVFKVLKPPPEYP
ncbi:MAG: hypothetical protein ACFFEU_00495 [Candidatus Thorarchaeota archaeon]